MSFTIFVILPNENVCSLRRLPPRSSIRAVRKMLELYAGLPAQMYDLAGPDGKFMADDILLQLDKNVWDGYVMRTVLRETWRGLYDVVVVAVNDVGHVLKHCAAHALKVEDDGKVSDEKMERGVAALFMASFLGLADLCKTLLSVGVDPDGKTPFGRTPLFAAMSGDHAHVVEVLLSHHATLEARDAEDTSALDFAQEQQAKECLRKVRHLKLFSRSSSAASSRASRSSARGSDHSGGVKTQRPVIRIPTGASAEAEASDDKAKAPVLTSCEDGSVSPSRNDSSPRLQEPSLTNGASVTPETSTGGSRLSPRTLFQHGEVYTWENNLRSVSRASSAAGTQVRIPVPGGGREGVSSGRSSSRASNGVTWSDTMSVSSGANRRSSLRLSVQDLSIGGLNPVLKISRPTSPPHTVHTTDGKLTTIDGVCKHCVDQEPTTDSFPDTKEISKPHVPGQDPPRRPPSPVENNLQMSRGEEENQAVAGSIRILVPDLLQGRKDDGDSFQGTETGGTSHNSVGEKEKGHVEAARDSSSRSSPRAGARLAKSRRKQEASWSTMKRRLKLAKDQNRHATPHKAKLKQNVGDKDATRATFEQWLQRKRREKERRKDSSEADSSSSEGAADDEESSAENERAFNDWLRELKERPLRGPHPFTPASLHRRKSRPLKNLIQIGVTAEDAVPGPGPDTYMTAYKEWRKRGKGSTDCEEQLTSTRDLKEAQKRMEEKRKSLLAMALTYEDWLELSEQRQKVMQALLRADSNKLAHLEQSELHTRRAPRQISFHQWREKVDKKREEETRHGGGDEQHMRGGKQPEIHRLNNGGFLLSNNDGIRSSAAIPHDEWLKRKKKETEKSRNDKKGTGENGSRKTASAVATNKQETSKRNGQAGTRTAGARENRSVVVSEDGKESAWEMWLQRKHQTEMEQLSQNMYEGKQLVLNVQEKKTPRVTQC